MRLNTEKPRRAFLSPQISRPHTDRNLVKSTPQKLLCLRAAFRSRKVDAAKIALLARGILLLQSILQGGAANFHKFACRFFAAIF